MATETSTVPARPSADAAQHTGLSKIMASWIATSSASLRGAALTQSAPPQDVRISASCRSRSPVNITLSTSLVGSLSNVSPTALALGRTGSIDWSSQAPA